jgi:SAM-dependent methyltransferase
VSSGSTCPLCRGQTEAAFRVGDRNREITSQRFPYRRCSACRTVFLAEIPENLDAYYPDDYYGAPSLTDLDRAAGGEASKLELIRPYAGDGALVEIGPAFGVFARAAEQAGFQVTTIEMDARCCDYLRDVVGVSAVCSDAPEEVLPELGHVRVVALWHVLEHLPRPWEVLARAADALEPGGVLALATPNPDSLQFRLLGARWAHVDAPRHLFLIPFPTLSARMDGLGFDVGAVTTTDPAGTQWNAFGWEYAIRRHPARRPSTRLTRICARLLALGLAPLERRGMNGTAYTAVFVKR